MESVESPLDVLSRAATMVQDSLPNTVTDESAKQASTKQLPTTKWKRDRRRLPEYSRKSDPKLPENTPPELQQHSPASPVDGLPNRPFSTSPTTTDSGTRQPSSKQDAPIDMSVRQRGLPPSYTQAISSPGYRTGAGFRPSVITQTASPPALAPSEIRSGLRNELPSGISMCDPIIDEHFRRSLGKDYLMLFNNNKNTSQSEPSPARSSDKLSNKHPNNPSARELMEIDTASLSVDDHFAKALGDTWLKLNQKEPENGAADKPTVVSL